MNAKQSTRISKFLSLVLRHRPDEIGIKLDSAGWVEVDELLAAATRAGMAITREQLDHVVASNEKRRFAFSDDGTRIRAQQGHSVEIELDYAPAEPPEFLYHGTATRHLDSIMEKGLLRMNRSHVHLSPDRETAVRVGRRHGKPVFLIVEAARLHATGAAFFLTPNDVWLVEHVRPAYLRNDKLR